MSLQEGPPPSNPFLSVWGLKTDSFHFWPLCSSLLSPQEEEILTWLLEGKPPLHENAAGTLRSAPGTEEDSSGRSGETRIKAVIWVMVLHQRSLSILTMVLAEVGGAH